MQDPYERGAVADVTGTRHDEEFLDRDPRDLLSLRNVGGLANVVSTGADIHLVGRVGDTDGRLERDRPGQGPRTPAGLFLPLTPRGVDGLLILLDDADGNLPAPTVVDEAVPLQHQEMRLRLVKDHRHGDTLHADNMVFESFSVRCLDIDQLQVDPSAAVDGARAEHEPLRMASTVQRVMRHAPTVPATGLSPRGPPVHPQAQC